MTRRIVEAVSRALSAWPTPARTDHDHPHFHRGAQGHPAACYERGCDRPHLDIG
jgi:hypothetical protein